MDSPFYAVHKGKKIGVFRSWAETKASVDGYPGARYKKFANLEDAQAFVATAGTSATTSATATTAKKRAAEEEEELDNVLFVFTDGAHSSKTKRTGVGVSFDEPLKGLAISKKLPLGSTHQQAELDAVLCALFILDKNAKEVANKRVVIWTDSDYTCKCVKEYIHVWRKNGWLKSDGDTVKHRATIDEAAKLLEKHQGWIELRHISEVGLVSHTTKRDDALALGRTSLRVWLGNKCADELATGK